MLCIQSAQTDRRLLLHCLVILMTSGSLELRILARHVGNFLLVCSNRSASQVNGYAQDQSRLAPVRTRQSKCVSCSVSASG